MNRIGGRHKARGFSLIEALIAMVLLAIGVVGMLGVFPVSFGYVQADSERMQAIGVGQQYLDTLHQWIRDHGNTGLPSPPTVAIDGGKEMEGTGNSAPGSFGNFSVTSNNCPTAASSTSALQFDCAVTVTWSQSGVQRQVKIESQVTQQ